MHNSTFLIILIIAVIVGAIFRFARPERAQAVRQVGRQTFFARISLSLGIIILFVVAVVIGVQFHNPYGLPVCLGIAALIAIVSYVLITRNFYKQVDAREQDIKNQEQQNSITDITTPPNQS